MTNPLYYQNQSIPAYSGVTINITNPTLNAGALPTNNMCNPYNCCKPQPNFNVQQNIPVANSSMLSPMGTVVRPNDYGENQSVQVPLQNYNSSQLSSIPIEKSQPNYPPQYYLNNYNYVQNGDKSFGSPSEMVRGSGHENISSSPKERIDYNILQQEEDMSSSENIKNELDARLAEQKELEKKGTKTKVVALTNEYIMSLENYLNNPNTEIRLMASKEILTRLDEDKDRYDDAALNALLNKMLQDPEKLIRIAALSAFSSQLASGNEFTFELLNNIQNDPNADKEDVVQAADCLLKMSSIKETKFIPAEKQNVQSQQVEQ